MAVEEPFTFFPDSRPHPEEFGDESWTRVDGGGLDQPIFVRIAWSNDGRPVISGLVVGADGAGREITSSSLRKIRIGAIISELFRGFSTDQIPDYNDLDAQIEWGLMNQTYIAGAPELPDPSAIAARSADLELIAVFARRYLEELRANPRRAMTATADALMISRATANRWAARARDEGLLPPKASPSWTVGRHQ